MSTIKIDKRVPLQGIFRPGRPDKYPWKAMRVGDSFLVPEGINISSVMGAAQRRYGIHLTRRTDPNTGRTRVWRIA